MLKISKKFAEIAQLVEHNLAKVRVASSSLVFRSKKVLHVRHWKGGRVVDYSGLENRRAERHRGFESLPFRREASSESCSIFFCAFSCAPISRAAIRRVARSSQLVQSM